MSLQIAIPLLILSCVVVAESFELCDNPKLNAALNMGRDTLYFFQGDYYWVYEDNRLVSEEPQYIEDRWEWAPSYPDAVSKVHALNDSVVFFKANLIWAYNEKNELQKGYPKYLKSAFPGIPFIDVEAAASIYWKNLGTTVDYLFKGDYFWIPGQRTITKTKEGFKLNLPTDATVTAAFSVTDPVLVTKDVFYVFDQSTGNILQSYPPQPQKMSTAYFGCPAASLSEYLF